MLFNSFLFILIFFPLTLIGWYLLNHYHCYRAALAFLTGMSFWFYGMFSWKFLVILIVSILISHALSLLIREKCPSAGPAAEPDPSGRHWRRALLVTSIVFHLGLLFVFKYYGFFIGNIDTAFHADLPLYHIIMPIGISFYVFQQLSYLIDRCNGTAPHYCLLDYMAYVAFFPKLIEGPIAFHEEIISQFHDEEKRRFSADRFARGCVLFIIGLSKKVLLADTLALPVNYGFEQTYYLDTLTVILVMLAYTFEIYFDFSGYCDMASGLSLMLGITLPVNFNSPYQSATVKELWQRWHMTLSRFFIRYVYIPLGGSRKGRRRTMINVLIVFILSGLWHGAGWTYVCWGLMQGLLVVWDDMGIVSVRDNGTSSRKKHYLLRDHPLLTVSRRTGQFFTFLFFVISLIFFRSENMAYAGAMFRRHQPDVPDRISHSACNLRVCDHQKKCTGNCDHNNLFQKDLYLPDHTVCLVLPVAVAGQHLYLFQVLMLPPFYGGLLRKSYVKKKTGYYNHTYKYTAEVPDTSSERYSDTLPSDRSHCLCF